MLLLNLLHSQEAGGEAPPSPQNPDIAALGGGPSFQEVLRSVNQRTDALPVAGVPSADAGFETAQASPPSLASLIAEVLAAGGSGSAEQSGPPGGVVAAALTEAPLEGDLPTSTAPTGPSLQSQDGPDLVARSGGEGIPGALRQGSPAFVEISSVEANASPTGAFARETEGRTPPFPMTDLPQPEAPGPKPVAHLAQPAQNRSAMPPEGGADPRVNLGSETRPGSDGSTAIGEVRVAQNHAAAPKPAVPELGAQQVQHVPSSHAATFQTAPAPDGTVTGETHSQTTSFHEPNLLASASETELGRTVAVSQEAGDHTLREGDPTPGPRPTISRAIGRTTVFGASPDEGSAVQAPVIRVAAEASTPLPNGLADRVVERSVSETLDTGSNTGGTRLVMPRMPESESLLYQPSLVSEEAVQGTSQGAPAAQSVAQILPGSEAPAVWEPSTTDATVRETVVPAVSRDGQEAVVAPGSESPSRPALQHEAAAQQVQGTLGTRGDRRANPTTNRESADTDIRGNAISMEGRGHAEPASQGAAMPTPQQAPVSQPADADSTVQSRSPQRQEPSTMPDRPASSSQHTTLTTMPERPASPSQQATPSTMPERPASPSQQATPSTMPERPASPSQQATAATASEGPMLQAQSFPKAARPQIAKAGAVRPDGSDEVRPVSDGNAGPSISQANLPDGSRSVPMQGGIASGEPGRRENVAQPSGTSPIDRYQAPTEGELPQGIEVQVRRSATAASSEGPLPEEEGVRGPAAREPEPAQARAVESANIRSHEVRDPAAVKPGQPVAAAPVADGRPSAMPEIASAQKADGVAFVETPEDTHRVTNQLVQATRLISRNGTSEVTIRLRPQELGEVTIRLVSAGETLTGEIAVGNRQVHDIVHGHLNELREALAGQGIQIDRIEVSIDNRGAQGADRDASQSFSQDRSGRTDREGNPQERGRPDDWDDRPEGRPATQDGRMDLMA